MEMGWAMLLWSGWWSLVGLVWASALLAAACHRSDKKARIAARREEARLEVLGKSLRAAKAAAAAAKAAQPMPSPVATSQMRSEREVSSTQSTTRNPQTFESTTGQSTTRPSTKVTTTETESGQGLTAKASEGEQPPAPLPKPPPLETRIEATKTGTGGGDGTAGILAGKEASGNEERNAGDWGENEDAGGSIALSTNASFDNMVGENRPALGPPRTGSQDVGLSAGEEKDSHSSDSPNAATPSAAFARTQTPKTGTEAVTGKSAATPSNEGELRTEGSATTPPSDEASDGSDWWTTVTPLIIPPNENCLEKPDKEAGPPVEDKAKDAAPRPETPNSPGP